MKNLIYQYWKGTMPPIATHSMHNIKIYANRIGADYIFEDNPSFDGGPYSEYYTAFKPVMCHDFDDYDNILFLDMDIFTVDGLEDSIFDQNVKHIGICDEWHKEEIRTTRHGNISTVNDIRWGNIAKEKWGAKVPLNSKGNPKIFNSGVVLYTREGIEAIRKHHISFKEYADAMSGFPKFYSLDQNYLGVLIGMPGVTYTKLDDGWNSYIHWGESKAQPRPVHDCRTEETKFVHMQLRGMKNESEDTYYKIVNDTVESWRKI